ncbi:MAG: DNA adenine methylase [Phycisphaerae bacterium]
MMPGTRFQGSKRKLAAWIGTELQGVEYDTVLDAFGGTGSVGYELKARGKAVTYNDILRFNYLIGRALIENRGQRLSDEAIDRAVTRDPREVYGDFVERTFGGIYFTDDENRWLDTAALNIERLASASERAIAYYALFQSAMAKRPYNLFHRANLYMREADVARTFGNKVTWDRPFESHFRKFAAEANRAIFDGGRDCRALNGDALRVEGKYDLVYIDPPYVSARGGGVNYTDFYHFLEGLADYERWPQRVDFSSKHRRFIPAADPWSSAAHISQAFDAVFERFADSALAVSYRSDGIPSIGELRRMLGRYKSRVRVIEQARYQYALSTNKRSTEVLLVAT